MYGIDCSDRVLMRARSWRWLTHRIGQLINVPPAVTAVIDGKGRMKTLQMPQTRIGLLLSPPEWR